MPICQKPKVQYHFTKAHSESRLVVKNRDDSDETLRTPEIPECVDDIVEKENTKRMLSKWTTLKRVKDMYEEKVMKHRSDVFRAKILRHMKARISEMPVEERKAWLTKLVRLAFLNKLIEIRDIKKMRNNLFLDKLNRSEGEDKDKILKQIADLKHVHEFKEMDDVHEILELKKAKKELKIKKARELELKARLRRLKKLDEIKQKEDRKLREERIEKINEIISVRKHWQEEMIRKIDEVTNKLVDDLVRIDDKREWYDKTHKEIEEEKARVIEDIEERKRLEEMAESIKLERELAIMKRDRKLKEIETWKKERKVRLWKLEKVNKFQNFLESRYMMMEAEENLFFKKIFNKLTASRRKKIQVDPWDMKPKMGERQREITKRKRLHSWIQSIVSSNKKKVVNKVRLKKYLEAMATPNLDMLMSYSKRVESISNIMFIIRGRILRNTFADKKKDYIAKEFNQIITKAKMDLRDIDPSDKLLCVQLTTKEYDLYLALGDEFLTIVEQVITPPEEACQDKTDVLCLTAEEREKMLELIKKRQQSRKVVKEARLNEYEAFQNRKALDDAWMKYMKKAYEEALRDLQSPCKAREDERVKIDVQQSRVVPKTAANAYEADRDAVSQAVVSVGLTGQQIQALLLGVGSTSKHAKKERVKMDFEKAMDSRVNRFVKTVIENYKDDQIKGKPYYSRRSSQIKDILNKEKAVRKHMIKDLPEDEEI